MNQSRSRDGASLADKTESASRIFDEISEILAGNGEVAQKTKDRLMLAGIRELFYLVKPIRDHERRISDLERKSLANLIEKHPKLALTTVVFILVLINLWFVSDFRKATLLILGFSPELVP